MAELRRVISTESASQPSTTFFSWLYFVCVLAIGSSADTNSVDVHKYHVFDLINEFEFEFNKYNIINSKVTRVCLYGTTSRLYGWTNRDVEKTKTDDNNESISKEVSQGKTPEYDLYAVRKQLNDSEYFPSNSVCDAVIHMLNVFFGGGVLGMHVAFYSMGLTSAGIGMIFLAALVGSSMCSLMKSAHKMYSRLQVARLTYPELAEKVALSSTWRRIRKSSRFIRYLVELTIMCKHFGSCMVYQVFIARTLKHLSVVTDEAPRENIKYYILAVSVLCVMLVMIRNMKFLTPFTVAINLYVSVLAMVIICYGSRATVDLDLTPSINSCEGFFKFIGICLFCLEGVSASLPIENIMAYPKNFSFVVLASITYATYIMILIGVFGFRAFGDKSVAPITIHLPWTHFTIMIKVFSCITMYLSYAKTFYFGFDVQWHYMKNWHRISKWWIWERFYRIINVTIISILACGIYDACAFMGFLGCVFGSLLCFIFPLFIKLGVDYYHHGLRSCCRLVMVTVMSSFVLLVITAGFYYSIRESVYAWIF